MRFGVRRFSASFSEQWFEQSATVSFGSVRHITAASSGRPQARARNSVWPTKSGWMRASASLCTGPVTIAAYLPSRQTRAASASAFSADRAPARVSFPGVVRP